MNFEEFKKEFQNNFKDMTKDVDHLFEVDIDKDELWNLYLDSFPEGTNEIFKERREFDCSACKHFIRTYGGIVSIKEGTTRSIWDFVVDDSKYNTVLDKMALFIYSKPVKDVFVSKEKKLGTNYNLQLLEDNTVVEWHHFYLELPSKFVDKHVRSIDQVKGDYRAVKDVFKRSLKEITTESVETVLELINQNSLYKGQEWKGVLETFLKCKKEYELTQEDTQDDYAWENSIKVGPVVGKIRNHSIGTLLVNISEGMELDIAVGKYEDIVAPSNYKRPKPIYSKKMLEMAEKTVTDMGYIDSLPRRFATLDDITVNNILFSNKDAAKRVGGTVFDELKDEIGIDPKKFSKVEEVSIDKFITDILPTTRELEVFVENKHIPSMVSLIAPENKDAKNMFKWNNAFGWAYNGNITDSMLKENVKMAGGNVNGDLRFSIQWNDGKEFDQNDLDAHCREPSGFEIYYADMRSRKTGGNLDVDIIHPVVNEAAVENIVYPNKSQMDPGTYKFFVHCYTNRFGTSGFRAEIEFGGEIFEFDYNKPLGHGENVQVAEVYFDGINFTMKEMIDSEATSKDIWNIKTNQFTPVSVVMYSPNYWDEQKGIGHQHVFFMLKDCINEGKPNGFFNEFLKHELNEHRKVFEALGSKMAVKYVDDQLSGVGFSLTKRNEILIKVKGRTERIIRVKV